MTDPHRLGSVLSSIGDHGVYERTWTGGWITRPLRDIDFGVLSDACDDVLSGVVRDIGGVWDAWLAYVMRYREARDEGRWEDLDEGQREDLALQLSCALEAVHPRAARMPLRTYDPARGLIETMLMPRLRRARGDGAAPGDATS